MRPTILLCSLLLLSASGFSQDSTDPLLKGPVTRFVSMSDFDVRGKRIVAESGARITMHKADGTAELLSAPPKLYVGQSVDVYGQEQRKTHAIKATKVVVYAANSHEVSGLALIEEVLSAGAGNSGTDRLVRADGYRISITPKTQVKFVKPLSSAAEIGTNLWVEYKGKWNPNGVVVADKVSFYKNVISDGLKKERDHWEYDPNAVSADSHQSPLSKGFRGKDASWFPPHKDAAMEARVRAIGEKLVPAYQKGLAAGDPTKINFRFYLIDAPKERDAFALPSGIVLVPYQVIEKLQNDSQVAAVLADKVACLMEEQPIPLPLSNGQLAESAGWTAAEFVPFAGLGASVYQVGSGVSAHERGISDREQRERVSLSLMQDAGYDLLEAPKAWWILSLKKGGDMSKSGPPSNAMYMYGLVGERLAAESRGQ